MKHLLRCAFFVALLLCGFCLAHAQSKRQVTVVTVDDKKYEGRFVKADELGVVIEDGDVKTTLKLDNVKSIIFEGIASAPPPASSNTALSGHVAAFNAIKALRRLSGAIDVGVTFFQYGPLVVETKAAIDEAMYQIPEGKVRQEILSAMEDYAIAGQAWSASIQEREGGIPATSSLALQLANRYNFNLGKAKKSDRLDRKALLQIIWSSASSHTATAANLLAASLNVNP